MAIGEEKVDAKMVGKAINKAMSEEKKEKELGQQSEAVAPEEEAVDEMAQYIYIGPNVPGLTAYTVIEGQKKYPVHIKKIVKECAAAGKLFVPVTQLTTAEPKTKVKGTLENRNYKKVLEYLANGKKGE